MRRINMLDSVAYILTHLAAAQPSQRAQQRLKVVKPLFSVM